jgi:hypothetical protein
VRVNLRGGGDGRVAEALAVGRQVHSVSSRGSWALRVWPPYLSGR